MGLPQGLQLSRRPTRAAIDFVLRCVTAVRDPSGQITEPGSENGASIMTAPWFRWIYQTTLQWYGSRYGQALEHPRNSICGAVLVYGTPFLVEVPATIVEPGRPSETVWLIFPDNVFAEEDAMTWLVTPPNLDAVPEFERVAVKQDIEGVATSLRTTRVALVSGVEGDVARSFCSGALTHLESAAKLLVCQDEESVQKSYWEMQLAIESAFKAFLERKTGGYPKIHDLFSLSERAEPLGLSVDRELLERIPRWREMTDLRYAQGTRNDIRECFDVYRTVLAIVPAVVRKLSERWFGTARFEIARAPWTRTEDPDFP